MPIPLIAATGLPGYESVGRFAIFAPLKTPEAIIARLKEDKSKAVLELTVRNNEELAELRTTHEHYLKDAKDDATATAAKLATLTEQYQWLAANAMAVVFGTEHAERLKPLIHPPLDLPDPYDCPLARAVECAKAIESGGGAVVAWVKKRGWKCNVHNSWIKPTGEHTAFALPQVVEMQRRADLGPFDWMLKNLR